MNVMLDREGSLWMAVIEIGGDAVSGTPQNTVAAALETLAAALRTRGLLLVQAEIEEELLQCNQDS